MVEGKMQATLNSTQKIQDTGELLELEMPESKELLVKPETPLRCDSSLS